MIKNLIASFVLYFVCVIFICIYSSIVYFVGHTFWQENAKGSLILDKDKNIRGSFLLAQQLENAKYFSPRTKEKFDSCCDLALYNDKLKDKLLERYIKAENPYDISLITPSASLLDPYIMKRDAIKQAIQIAAKRSIKPDNLLRLIEKYSLNNSEPFFELEIVNTTLLNVVLAGYYDK